MTMDLLRVWLYRPATWRRTRPWPRPRGLGQGGVGGRLPADQACADMMSGVVPHFALVPCWPGQPREFLQEAV
jgi:hypothetical protein